MSGEMSIDAAIRSVMKLQKQIDCLYAENDKLKEKLESFNAPDSDELLLALRAKNVRLQKVLSGLSTAIDAFWNDEARPSIDHMSDNIVHRLEKAQRIASAILGTKLND